MRHLEFLRWPALGAAVASVALLAWPLSGTAQQTIGGQAAAVRANVDGLLGGTTIALADTGTLASSSDARDASQLTDSVLSLLTGEVLRATTIGWPDRVASEASLANLALSVAGNSIGADFVMAEATAVLRGAGVGTTSLDNFSLNGAPISVTGEPNQTIPIPGGRVVINEQIVSAGSIVVNALRVTVAGVADVVIGSATARIQ